MKKIVITGGPCAGKSSALSVIKERMMSKGYKVLCIPETATELIQGGITPWNAPSALQFQIWLSTLQLAKEAVYEDIAKQYKEEVLLVCDRGLLDNRAYLTEEEYKVYLGKLGLSTQEIMKRYDAIFHLESAACGAQEFYTTENGSVRTETIEQAKQLDQRHKEIAQAHPCFKAIGNEGTFEDKLNHLIEKIEEVLEGEKYVE